MNLNVYNKKNGILNIEIDNKNILQFSNSYDIKSIYRKALNNLDNDVDKVANITSTSDYHAFYWWLTYDIHRNDGISGTTLEYFIITLMEKEGERLGDVNIESSVVSNAFYNYVGNFDKNLLHHLIYFLRRFVRNTFGPLKILFRYLLLSFKRLSPIDNSISKNCTLFSSFENKSLARWNHYYEQFEKWCMVDLKLDNCVVNSDTNKTYNAEVVSFKNIYRAFKQTIKFHIEKKRNKKELLNTLFGTHIFRQSFLQSLIVFIRYHSLRNYFRNNDINKTIVMSSFGDPLNGTFIKSSLDEDIDTELHICRPYINKYRSEDRVTNADKKYGFLSYPNAKITVRDLNSKKYLKRIGVDSTDISKSTKKEIKKECKDGLLLLFSDKQYNISLLKLLLKIIKKEGALINNIYIREHPSVPINTQQEKTLGNLKKPIINLNNYNWNDIRFTNIVTFCANSTSGLEAYFRGANLIWLPFLSHNFMQFIPYLQHGHVASNYELAMEKTLDIIKYESDS